MKKKALLIFMAALVLLQIYTLFVPPISGVQDDGTLYHVLVENGLYRTDENSNFNMVYGMEGDVYEASTVPINIGKFLSGLFSENLFFVPILTVLYILLFDLGIYLVFAKMNFSTPWLGYVMMGAVFLIFGDLGYMAYFNSITYEGAALAYFSLLVGATVHLALSKKAALWNLILVALSAFLFVGTAKQMFWFIIPAILLLVRLAFFRKEVWWKIVSALLVVAVLFGNITLFTKGNVRNEAISRYNSVFYGVMKDASEQEVDGAIEWFHLPKESKKWAGTTFYEDLEFQSEKMALGEEISYGKVVSYYLTHPIALSRLMGSAAGNSFFVQQEYLTYSMIENQQKPTLGIWNALKKVLPIQSVLMLAIFFVALIVACVRYRSDAPKLYDIGLWLILSALSIFLAPGVFFGYAQISKTMFPFALVLDTILLFVLGWGIESLMVRQKKVKEKYGIH